MRSCLHSGTNAGSREGRSCLRGIVCRGPSARHSSFFIVSAGSNALVTSCVTERFSKLEIQRELDLAGTRSRNRLPKSPDRRPNWTADKIDPGDLRLKRRGFPTPVTKATHKTQ